MYILHFKNYIIICITYSILILIILFCSSGVGRTGVFIALGIILERYSVEGMIDLFQTVKTLRIQRSAMVQTRVSNEERERGRGRKREREKEGERERGRGREGEREGRREGEGRGGREGERERVMEGEKTDLHCNYSLDCTVIHYYWNCL